MSYRDVTSRDAVLAAVAEYDRVGKDVFLDKYGFGSAREYFLVVGERQYDSKAIVGAAHGYQFPRLGPLTATDFGGGKNTVQPLLESLGFEVLVRTGAPAQTGTSAGTHFPDDAQALLPVEPIPQATLLSIQRHFHAVIRGRAGALLHEHHVTLPDLTHHLASGNPKAWLPIPGMYGGFRYFFAHGGDRALLVSDSWCRIAGGSGQAHHITVLGSTLVEEGFV
jgi:hypothetical protein